MEGIYLDQRVLLEENKLNKVESWGKMSHQSNEYPLILKTQTGILQAPTTPFETIRHTALCAPLSPFQHFQETSSLSVYLSPQPDL